VVIQLHLVAEDPDRREIAVSTTIQLDPDTPGWHTWLVDAVASQAEEGARRLRDQLRTRRALAGDPFIPLAAVVPAAGAGR
jgi:hypothetical protein